MAFLITSMSRHREVASGPLTYYLYKARANDVVQGRASEQGDEIAANWEENEDNIDMEHESGSSGRSWVIIQKRSENLFRVK